MQGALTPRNAALNVCKDSRVEPDRTKLRNMFAYRKPILDTITNPNLFLFIQLWYADIQQSRKQGANLAQLRSKAAVSVLK
jgi:hypothetical protein